MDLPKTINRRLRENSEQLDQLRNQLNSLRRIVVEDIEEAEATLRALQAQLTEIDRTLHQRTAHNEIPE